MSNSFCSGPLPAALANATSLSNINVGYNQIGGELGDWVVSG